MDDFFSLRETSYNLRDFDSLYSNNEKIVKFGTKSIKCREPQKWTLITEKVRNVSSFNTFKGNLRSKLPHCFFDRFLLILRRNRLAQSFVAF